LDDTDPAASLRATGSHRRRPRYSGKNPRRFEEKYKERDPERYASTVAKVIASGKTPAGTHRPIMVTEILEILAPKPGEAAVDCTLGYGGHAQELMPRLRPGGRLIGLDVDGIELPRTEARLRELGFGPEVFTAHRTNFAGLPRVLAAAGLSGVDIILADLGVSSMQLDDPARGFSMKFAGPLDMRMNNHRGRTAADFIRNSSAKTLAVLFRDNADEPQAARLAEAMAGREFKTTLALAEAVRRALPGLSEPEREASVRRVFQAVRIGVNEEFSGLENFLRVLPGCLKAGGRVAILTFHSGEDRRVKKAFQEGYRTGIYSGIAKEVLRPSSAERYANPRSASAKLRWAILQPG
jgi:16S rRNA (cytosine1402-N4)-methyltransferase